MYTGTGTVPVQYMYPGTVYYFKKHVATQALVPSTQSVITTLTTGTYVPPSLYLFQFSGTGTSTPPHDTFGIREYVHTTLSILLSKCFGYSEKGHMRTRTQNPFCSHKILYRHRCELTGV